MIATDRKRLNILLKDCTKGFYQQMYFWGKDVMHPSGNQLLKYGFEKTPSQGLKGTSCYTLPIEKEGETVELYGSCAAYYSKDSNVVFLRQRNRFYHWISDQKLIAGRWSQSELGKCSVEQLFTSMLPFLKWWINYEQWILNQHGEHYRQQCYKEWSQVNSKLTWLNPEHAMQWVKEFLDHKEHHVRPKHYA